MPAAVRSLTACLRPGPYGTLGLARDAGTRAPHPSTCKRNLTKRENSMALWEWSDSYSIGNETLDGHHRTLFGLFNRLYESCFAGNDTEVFNRTLNELDAYAKLHFQAEEQFMRERGYSDIERHHALHSSFTSKIDTIGIRKRDDSQEGCRQIILYLGNWLKQHVIVEDAAIVPGPEHHSA